MPRQRSPRFHLKSFLAAALLLCSPWASRGQNAATPSPAAAAGDLVSLTRLVLQLQSQLQALDSELVQLRSAQQQALLDREALRTELDRTRGELLPGKDNGARTHAWPASGPSSSETAATPGQPGPAPGASLETRVSRIEDDQELMNDKILEQSQTKVESGSKYRVRLSGIVLFNTEIARGAVDNLDFPQLATSAEAPAASGAFSGSLRQSQIGIEAFGPDIAGARTSANVKFDFAGGFPGVPNGVAFGSMRLRTGTIRFDWENTSIVAGQDSLFFAPLAPTSLASLAIPALSYAGNLWSWSPQIRIEHRIALADNAHLLLQAGVLDPLTGMVPEYAYRYPTAGEQSGQPAYATRIAWSRRAFGRELTIGLAGYYGKQNWGYGRAVNAWAITSDFLLPLGNYLSLAGEVYRGQSLGEFGGGAGQNLLLSGPLGDPATAIHGLDSIGGWVQLKYQPRANLEFNLAYGQDNPFAGELRAFPASSYYYGYSISRNQSPFVNFIYRARSDVLFSLEYRRLQTYALDSNPDLANQISISLGYLF